MSDNPTTGEEILKDVAKNSPYAGVREHAAKALASNPASGEWTAGQLYDTYKSYHNARDAWNAIADSINAAVAASVEYWQGVATQEWHKGFAAGTEQLAAEKQQAAFDVMDVARRAKRKVEELEQQLAAERRRTLDWARDRAKDCPVCGKIGDK